MDELLLYGPWVLSAGALLLAANARNAVRRAQAHAAELERTVATLRAPSPPPVAPVAPVGPARGQAATSGPCPAVLEERLGAFEARLASLADAVREAAVPDADEVEPMRPPVPASVEPLTAPRSGWRMFP